MKRFAVFGDVHGRVALMMTLARRWQEHEGTTLDGVLQVGDMGVFPDPHRLDKATARFVQDDPDELGFRDFLGETQVSATMLGHPDSPPIVFCRGNHEDFQFLERYRSPVSLDPWGKLIFIPDGATFEYETTDETVRIAAFGGAAPLSDEAPRQRGRKARAARRKRQRKISAYSMQARFIGDAADRAFNNGQPAEILLTHAGPTCADLPGGSPHLYQLARRLSPHVHLFGHHHVDVGPTQTEGGLLVGLHHLEFLPDHTLRPKSWGILTLDGANTRFTWAEPQVFAWLPSITRHTWRDAYLSDCDERPGFGELLVTS